MKKKIFIKVRNVSVVMLAVCGVSIFCSGMCVSAETQREISSIQIMGFKHPVKEQLVDEHPRHAEKNKLLNAEENSLDKDIAALAETDVLSDAPELDEKEFHIPVTLHYTDGTKDTYCFFKVDDTFYMKNEAGSVYADADFIGEYVSLPEEQDTGFNQDSELQSGVSIHLPDELALSMAKDMEVLDERYYLFWMFRRM